MKSAVVFAYHNVGVRCLKTLIAGGVQIPLVVTHRDAPGETIWFDSVARTAEEHELPCIAPDGPPDAALVESVKSLAPDFVFSFYYRHLLPVDILRAPRAGAFNMHGSLLPKYRGRVPVNWAVLNGETETGASLHYMEAKPDAGDIVGQTAVPILPDDTAKDVFDKVTVAAEITLWQALPGLLAGTAPRRPNELARGSYFGGRKPEDGRIDWTQPARRVYNLIRAVAPPYPGAFTDLPGGRCIIEAARPVAAPLPPHPAGLHVLDGVLFGFCGDGQALRILRASVNGRPLSTSDLSTLRSP